MKTPALSVTASVISILKIKPRIFHYLSSGSSRPQAIADTLSGITVGLIALPVALALGVASIPIYRATPFLAPAIGIFTAIIGGLIVSILGGSRVQEHRGQRHIRAHFDDALLRARKILATP